METRKRRSLGWIFFLISTTIFLWGVWPEGTRNRSVPISFEAVQAPLPVESSTFPEPRQLEIKWPGFLRVGDRGVVRVELVNAGMGGGSLSFNQAGSVNRLVEAYLELGGMPVSPNGEIREPLQENRPAIFQWTLLPGQPGDFEGTVWIHLRLISIQAGHPLEGRRVISAQRFQIHAVHLFGLSGVQARVLGLIGIILGALIALETYLSGTMWKNA